MAKIKAIDKWAGVKVNAHKNSGEVNTKPNQAQTIRDILFRNTAGMAYDNHKTPYYEDQATFGSQAMNKIFDMEPTEKLQFLEELNTNVTNLQSQIKQHEEEKAALLKAQQEAYKNANETQTETE